MKVAILTNNQLNSLIGQSYDNGSSFFYPILDFFDNWVVSEFEIVNCVNPNFYWLKDLQLVEYVKKTDPIFF